MSESPNNLAAYIWSLADLLRGDFKQSQYGRIILPFTLLRRLECVLAPSKEAVLADFEEGKGMGLTEEALENWMNAKVRSKHNLQFYNTSKMDLSKLGESDIKDNLESYLVSFSRDAREIFEYFKFSEFVGQLSDANLLYKIVQKVRNTDLSPKAISNHDMGKVFEELIRRFAESSNETAGEHFTPRDIVHLTTSLVFMEDDEALQKPGIIRTIYDPTAGTGGFLSEGMEYVEQMNPQAVMRAYGQELNPESYAICKADMLIKGQEVDNIKLGNTLSNDQLQGQQFDYMLSNPPFGVDWKKIEKEIRDEHTLKGFDGRFGPGLPRVSDGSLLFLLHLISKMRDDAHDYMDVGGRSTQGAVAEGSANVAGGRTQGATAEKTGGRIGIILNGSPLFTGGAGSGESEIRRFILEADLLEAIVALPTDMFYNTGIATYVWVLSNKKSDERKGKVQLINGVNLCGKMRKSLGSKRNIMSEEDIRTITRTFGGFEAVEPTELDDVQDAQVSREAGMPGATKPSLQKRNRGRQSATPKQEAPKTFASKIFDNHEFGYRRITIERPLRLSFQFSDERIDELRFAGRALNAPMKWIYQHYGQDEAHPWSDEPDCPRYGDLGEHEAAIRAHIKSHFSELKEKQIKELLERETWLAQKALMLKARQLQQAIGTEQHDDFNQYDAMVKAACKATDHSGGVKLESKEKKQITDAVSWKNPDAAKVIKKVHKSTKPDPVYGLFEENGKVVEYQPDGDLRDHENVPLDPSRSVNETNEEYFAKEVQPHVPEAWIDGGKRDEQDGEIGVVGYEIPFNRHFYVYQPPRDLVEIDAELDKVSAEIMELLSEVHS